MILVFFCVLILVRSVAGQVSQQEPPPRASSDPEPSSGEESTALPPPLPEAKTPRIVDKDKLRELARVPRQNWSFGSLSTPANAQKMEKEKETTTKRIAELQESVEGNDSDAEKYVELGDLYEDAEKSKDACAKAVKLFERRVQSECENGRFHVQYAKALLGIGDFQEAEKQALEGIRISPKEAASWQALGCLYLARSYAACETLGNQASIYERGNNKFVVEQPKHKCGLAGLLRPQVNPMIEMKTNSIPELPTSPFQAKETLEKLQELIKTNKDSRDRQVQQVLDRVEDGLVDTQIAQAKADLEKAQKCFAKVVALTPEHPESYDTLAGFHWAKLMMLSILGEESPKAYQDCLKELRSDQKHLAHQSPSDPEVQTDYASTIIAADAARLAQSNGGPKNAVATSEALTIVRRSLSQKSRAEISRVIRNLTKLAQSKDQVVAETSCRALASLAVIMGDLKKAEEYSRRALAIQPKNKENWDNLEMALFLQERKDEHMRVCQDRLAHVPTAYGHLRLAKCHIEHKDFSSAEKVLRDGLKKEPNDIPCQIALAAMLIRRSSQVDTLAEADVLLDQALKEIEQAGDKDSKLKGYYEDAILNRGIIAGLQGDMNASRAYFQAMPDDDDQAKTARALFSD
jgi:tetratricopeptide (TPR) repeat protein